MAKKNFIIELIARLAIVYLLKKLHFDDGTIKAIFDVVNFCIEYRMVILNNLLYFVR